jgi:hypothetical protein
LDSADEEVLRAALREERPDPGEAL